MFTFPIFNHFGFAFTQDFQCSDKPYKAHRTQRKSRTITLETNMLGTEKKELLANREGDHRTVTPLSKMEGLI